MSSGTRDHHPHGRHTRTGPDKPASQGPTDPTGPGAAPDGDAAGIDRHPSVTRVRDTLAVLGVTGSVLVLPDPARTAAHAAEQLGVTVGQIANSLVFAVPDRDHHGRRRPLLVLTSGAHRVDTGHLADVLAVEHLDRAAPEEVRRWTGFAIGGVAPVSHPEPVQTLVDVTLASYQEIWAAAGHPRTVFPTHYDELLRITAGSPVEVE